MLKAMWLSLEFSRTYYSSCWRLLMSTYGFTTRYCVPLLCLFKNFHNKSFIHIYVYNMSRASLVAQMVKNLPAMWETQLRSLGQEDPLEKGMATHSSILVFLPGEFHGQRKLMGYSPWGRKELDMTEPLTHTHTHTHTHTCIIYIS